MARRKNVTFYITEGRFLYKSDDGSGKWMPAELPKVPSLEDLQ